MKADGPSLEPGNAFRLNAEGEWDVMKVPSSVISKAEFSGYLTIEGFKTAVFETPEGEQWAFGDRKLCTKCGMILSLESFTRFKRGGMGRDSRCRKCKSLIFKEWRSNPKKKISHNRSTLERRRSLKKFVDSLKTNPCTDCKRIFEPWMMDYDHLGVKTFSISMLQKQHWSQKRILQEISLCELVCVGCHRERTFSRNGILSPISELKQNSCADCGSSFNPLLMDFDHIPGEIKRMAVSDLVSKRRSNKIVLNEIMKCDLVCCWCHRRRTHLRSQYAT